MAHPKDGGLPIQTHGELAALRGWVSLLIASRGSGRWSIDAVRGSRPPRRVEGEERALTVTAPTGGLYRATGEAGAYGEVDVDRGL